MAVIDNRLTASGDVLIIRTNTPAIGILAILGFIDTTTGEIPTTREFQKQFRYSFDGVNFSDFIELTVPNLQAIEVVPKDFFVIEYRYVRIGTDNTGELTVELISLSTTNDLVQTDDEFVKSIFNDYFNQYNVAALSWALNVLEKLYKQGIVPNYIERGKNQDTRQDQDFIDYWLSVTLYFSYFVILARTFKDFFTNETLLHEFLEERNFFLCNEIQMQDMLYLMQHYYQQISERGTDQIFLRNYSQSYYDNDFSVSISQSQSQSISDSYLLREIDGELLRLICYDVLDEFIYGLCRTEKISWNIGNSSPLYRGLSNQYELSKGFETTENAYDLNKYPLLEPDYVSIVQDGTKNILRLQSNIVSPQLVGIGTDVAEDFFIVDSNLSYQLTFDVKIDSNVNIITAGFKFLDRYDNAITPTSVITGVSTNYAIKNVSLDRYDKYYSVRCILWASNEFSNYDSGETYDKEKIVKYSGSYYKSLRLTNSNNQPDISPTYWRVLTSTDLFHLITPSILTGENLKMSLATKKVMPIIYSDSTTGDQGDMDVYNVKFKPLHFEYSHYFMNVKNFVHLWMKQNNGRYTTEEIEEIIRHYLFPYNTSFKATYL